jgi:hypothetical protein
MCEITQHQQRLLEPYAQAFAAMGQQVRSLSDEDAAALLNACYAASVTNCWCCAFDAAQWLQRELRREIAHRRRMAEQQALPAPPVEQAKTEVEG